MQLLREKSFQCNPPLFHAKTQFDEFASIEEVKEDPRYVQIYFFNFLSCFCFLL